jgi:hypothetical protein
MKASVVLFAIALNLFGIQAWAADPGDDEAAIRQRIEAYVNAYNAHDAAALADLWADDAVYLNRGNGDPITGRDAIRELFAGMFESGEASELIWSPPTLPSRMELRKSARRTATRRPTRTRRSM